MLQCKLLISAQFLKLFFCVYVRKKRWGLLVRAVAQCFRGLCRGLTSAESPCRLCSSSLALHLLHSSSTCLWAFRVLFLYLEYPFVHLSDSLGVSAETPPFTERSQPFLKSPLSLMVPAA